MARGVSCRPNDTAVEAAASTREAKLITTLSLPPEPAALRDALLDHLLQGDRVAILIEDQELSPDDAATVLGISRPLVVHRRDVGDLPFRYVGTHRRAKLSDVFGLRTGIGAEHAVMQAFADHADDLRQRYGAGGLSLAIDLYLDAS